MVEEESMEMELSYKEEPLPADKCSKACGVRGQGRNCL